ncbi:hypothetical protein SAMN05444673_3191 [Bacillus sp. OV166]|nr:hypothetical protein [Bacillus sp. OV166]SMQ78012.1 hypothetical protein SAMN05444673_3191 [Bacillus sp. OV166]
MGRYLVGVVTVICGILLLIINQGKDFKEVEESIVIAIAIHF